MTTGLTTVPSGVTSPIPNPANGPEVPSHRPGTTVTFRQRSAGETGTRRETPSRWESGNNSVGSDANTGRARWSSKAEQNLAHCLGDIARMASQLELGWTVREQASHLFRTARAAGLCRGRSLESVAAACVYAACRTTGVTVTRADVTQVAGCSLQEVENGYRVLNRELSLDAMVVRAGTLVPRLASELDVPGPVRKRATELAAEAETRGLDNGRNPSGVAAACLYLAAYDHGWLLTQSDVADSADVSVATLRKRKQGPC